MSRYDYGTEDDDVSNGELAFLTAVVIVYHGVWLIGLLAVLRWIFGF